MRGLEKALLEAEAGNALFLEKEKTNKKIKKSLDKGRWQTPVINTWRQRQENHEKEITVPPVHTETISRINGRQNCANVHEKHEK